MIGNQRYLPILKTKDAELRGVCSLARETKKGIVPLFELTKSRSTKKNPEGPVRRRLTKIAEDYGRTEIGLDLTSFTDLKNAEINDFFSSAGGFRKWTDFIAEQKYTFPHLHPVLLISDVGVDTEEKYAERHQTEVKHLYNSCEEIIYRIPSDYEAVEFDLEHFFKDFPSPIVLLDMEFIPKEKGKIYAKNALKMIELIAQPKYGVQKIILAGSSYPKDPTENGDDLHGENVLEEIVMFDICKKQHPKLIYGDYATIYPLPNLRAGSTGWVPRIDFPIVTGKSIIYHRDRKKINEGTYKQAYIRAAETVVNDARFQLLRKRIGDQNWGIRQIMDAAAGYPPGMSPSFWISVRINLHVTLRHLILSGG